MKRLVLVGGLVAAAVVVVLLLLPSPTAAPVDAAPKPMVAASTPSPTATPTAHPAATPPPATPPPSADDAQHPGAPPGARVTTAPEAVPLAKQEKLALLAPAVTDLEKRVTQLRHQADDDDKAGRADEAKRKRVAADRHEKRLGEIRASLAAGQLPPGFANPSSNDKPAE